MQSTFAVPSSSFYWGQIEADMLQALQRKSHVFVTGTNDENKRQIRADSERYRDAGIENVSLIFENQRLDAMPDPDHMDEAFRFLDARLRR